MLAGGVPGARAATEWAALVDGVLRKSGRIGDDAEPGAGVDKLVRRTPDGHPGAPRSTRADARTCRRSGVPGQAAVRARRHGRRPGARRLGRAAAPREPDPTLHEAVLADLENGVTSIWLAVGGRRAVADLRAVLAGVLLDLAPVVLDAGGGGHGGRGGVPGAAAERGSPTRPTCWAPSGSTRSGCGRAPASARTSRRSCRWPGGWRPSTRRCARSSSTRCRCTPRAAPTPRSWASRSRPGWPTCGR